MSELVRHIGRFPGYDFHSDGSVVSHSRREPFFMSPIKMGEYVGLQLRRADGTREKQYLHRLIAEAFHGPCPEGMHCRHLDGDRTNNKAENLAWGSARENARDKVAHGTSSRGERNSMAKLTLYDVHKMRSLRKSTRKSYASIGRQFGVSTMTAYRAITMQSWSQT